MLAMFGISIWELLAVLVVGVLQVIALVIVVSLASRRRPPGGKQ
jgi:hypothetical protein